MTVDLIGMPNGGHLPADDPLPSDLWAHHLPLSPPDYTPAGMLLYLLYYYARQDALDAPGVP